MLMTDLNDYFMSPKIRQILLHWGYQSVENNLLWFVFCSYKDQLLFFDKQELLQKAKEKVLKENAKSKHRNLSKIEAKIWKTDIKSWQK